MATKLIMTNPDSHSVDVDQVYNYNIILFGSGTGSTTTPLPFRFTDKTLGQYSDLPVGLPLPLVSLDASVPRRTFGYTLALLLTMSVCGAALQIITYHKDSATSAVGSQAHDPRPDGSDLMNHSTAELKAHDLRLA